MTFKQAVFDIWLSGDKTKQVHGYIFEACFSNGWLYNMGVYKSGKEWVVTDLNSGKYINTGRTRKQAVEIFQQRFCSKLERMVFDDNRWSKDSACRENAYEHLCRQFGEILEHEGM